MEILKRYSNLNYSVTKKEASDEYSLEKLSMFQK